MSLLLDMLIGALAGVLPGKAQLAVIGCSVVGLAGIAVLLTLT